MKAELIGLGQNSEHKNIALKIDDGGLYFTAVEISEDGALIQDRHYTPMIDGVVFHELQRVLNTLQSCNKCGAIIKRGVEHCVYCDGVQ